MRQFSTPAVNPFRFGDAGNWRLPLLAALLLAAATLGGVFHRSTIGFMQL